MITGSLVAIVTPMLEDGRLDIARFKKEKGLDRLVMVWCGSTEVYREGELGAAASRHKGGRVRDATHVPTQKRAIVITIDPNGHHQL